MSAPSTAESAAQARSEAIAFRRGVSLLVLTLLVPGSAQLIAGGKGLGRFAVRVWAWVLAVLALFILLTLVRRNWALALYAHPWTQWLVAVLALVLGLGWALLLLDAWRLSRPGGMGSPRKYILSGIAAVLAIGMTITSFQASAMAQSQAQLFGSVFGGGGSHSAADDRINILLLGADAEPDRPGIRTDTIMVASMSATTGRLVLFSLPRNLQHAPIPQNSPLHALYPNGYWCEDQSCLLNAIHSEAEKHASLFPGVEEPGLVAIRGVVSEILGLPIHYQAVIDMGGFESLVDALGGVTLDIAAAVPIGGGSSKVEGYIQPGRNVHLNGYQALWFARSRHGSSDYERMTRQKCLVNAIAKQASPANVVARFTDLARAGASVLSTDVPTSDIGTLVELAGKGRALPIASTSFAPPLIEPVKPDFALIRSTVQADLDRSRALDEQAAAEAAAAAAAAASASASPTAAPASEAAASETTAPPGEDAVVSGTKPTSGATFTQERRTEDLTDICSVAG